MVIQLVSATSAPARLGLNSGLDGSTDQALGSVTAQSPFQLMSTISRGRTAPAELAFGSAKDFHETSKILHKEFRGVEASHLKEEDASKLLKDLGFETKDDSVSGKASVKDAATKIAKSILGDSYKESHPLVYALDKAIVTKAGKVDGELEFKDLNEAIKDLKDKVGVTKDTDTPKLGFMSNTFGTWFGGLGTALGIWALYSISKLKQSVTNLGQQMVSTLQDMMSQSYSMVGQLKKLGAKFKQMLGIQGTILDTQGTLIQNQQNILGISPTASAPKGFSFHSESSPQLMSEQADSDDSANAPQQGAPPSPPKAGNKPSDKAELERQTALAKAHNAAAKGMEGKTPLRQAPPAPVVVQGIQPRALTPTTTRHEVEATHTYTGLPARLVSLGGHKEARVYAPDESDVDARNSSNFRDGRSADKFRFVNEFIGGKSTDAANDGSYNSEVGNGTNG